MKIYILTGKFGMGHMISALAIKQHIEVNNSEADIEIVDWFDYVSPALAKKFYQLFELLVIKGYRFYNKRYRRLENMKTDQKPEFYSLFELFFKRFMKEKKPNLIISTLPTCSQIVSWYKEKTGSGLPLITCVTDITGHSEWISKNTDFYMVGSQSVKEKLLMKGVLPHQIYETGIPIRLDFSINETTRNRNCIHSRKRILIMGGGLGFLPTDLTFYDGLEHMSELEVTIITGKNHKLYNQLSGRYKSFHILGYVDNVYDYMKQMDAVISKPGGITTFEAIYSEVPILALNPFLQQEIYNAEYIKEMNIGTVIGSSGERSLQDITEILTNGQLDVYRSNIQELKKRLQENSLTQIVNEAIHMSSHYNSYNPTREDYSINEAVNFNI